jgi:hypothetical protein
MFLKSYEQLIVPHPLALLRESSFVSHHGDTSTGQDRGPSCLRERKSSHEADASVHEKITRILFEFLPIFHLNQVVVFYPVLSLSMWAHLFLIDAVGAEPPTSSPSRNPHATARHRRTDSSPPRRSKNLCSSSRHYLYTPLSSLLSPHVLPPPLQTPIRSGACRVSAQLP